jgi:uncharacterized protein involved in response to NO
MKSIEATMDAYRYFFPVGWLLGVWGVLLWLLFPLNLVTYPGPFHPQVMMGGFFLCFVCGFLMTAAPKFTASFPPTRSDLWLSATLLAGLFISALFEKILIFHFAVLLLLLFLVSFFLRRFFHRTQSPPDAFVFVGVGMGSAVTGVTLLILGDFGWAQDSWLALGRLLFLQGYILALVLGIGSRLVPALLGRGPLPNEARTSAPKLGLFLALAFLFVLSYVLEAFFASTLGNVLRSFLMSFMLFRFWKIHLAPARKGFQPFWLWLSGWSLLAGQWGATLLPDYRQHFLHLVFVSGLGLMTLMIATRVSLSHGGHGLDLERNSKAVWGGALLLMVAAVTRLSAALSAGIYQSHLVYASCAWILGLLVWGWVYLPKIFFVKKMEGQN